MKEKRGKVLVFFGLVLLVGWFFLIGYGPCVTAAAEKVYTIKAAHSLAVGSVRHKTYVNFAELAEKYSKGRLKVKVHPAASLFGDKETVEACLTGSIQMVFQPTSQLASIFPTVSLLAASAVYPKRDAYFKFLKSDEIMKVLEPLEKKRLFPLGMNTNSLSYIFMSNIKPFRKPYDQKGAKFRVPPAPLFLEMVKATGASPVTIEFSEVATSLQTGAVDGVFTSVDSGYSSKLHELTKYFMCGTILGPSPNIAVINKGFWDSLPKDLQDIIIKKVWPENLEYNNKICVSNFEKAMAAYKARGDMYFLDTVSNLADFEKALTPVREMFIKKAHKGAYELIQKGME